jgi:hypothetical protein
VPVGNVQVIVPPPCTHPAGNVSIVSPASGVSVSLSSPLSAALAIVAVSV